VSLLEEIEGMLNAIVQLFTLHHLIYVEAISVPSPWGLAPQNRVPNPPT